MVWPTAFFNVEFNKGPFGPATGAHYDASMPADYTVPNDKVLYMPWVLVNVPMGPPGNVNYANWKIYVDNVQIKCGNWAYGIQPIEAYAPPGSKMRFYSRIMATQLGIDASLQVSFPHFIFEKDGDWAWEAVVGVANPVDPATLPWP
jgi:hypothetical protein